VGQPPVAHHAEAQAHRIDRATALAVDGPVDRALDDDGPGGRLVGRRVTADAAVDVAADEDARRVEVGGAQQHAVGLGLDGGRAANSRSIAASSGAGVARISSTFACTTRSSRVSSSSTG
jgi:hypothetical protein